MPFICGISVNSFMYLRKLDKEQGTDKPKDGEKEKQKNTTYDDSIAIMT